MPHNNHPPKVITGRVHKIYTSIHLHVYGYIYTRITITCTCIVLHGRVLLSMYMEMYNRIQFCILNMYKCTIVHVFVIMIFNIYIYGSHPSSLILFLLLCNTSTVYSLYSNTLEKNTFHRGTSFLWSRTKRIKW